ncbi:hypothetical protein LPB248_09055 [Flavobacterium sp. LPB0248]|uniref:hypothetical protein n=1 Tax=Flavobacterium sp. LPB0248 TaxID=2614441 RepID=UPI0015A6A8B3|nr:hypothetical protein [Flavobacterium sp. LPB0248]QLC66428.1 hypothetical protein LPB248_09055 [Flavobacterium sp. LPB0248]
MAKKTSNKDYTVRKSLDEFCDEKDKIKNSGNQPEFQSSIKKRTVNQTVVCGTKVSSFMFQVTKAT